MSCEENEAQSGRQGGTPIPTGADSGGADAPPSIRHNPGGDDAPPSKGPDDAPRPGKSRRVVPEGFPSIEEQEAAVERFAAMTPEEKEKVIDEFYAEWDREFGPPDPKAANREDMLS